jgi:hypothetical protein
MTPEKTLAPDPLTSQGGADSIPMLTEVVTTQRYAPEHIPSSVSQVDWAGLAERIRDNVGERLVRRTRNLLDTRLQDKVQALVDRATESLVTELRGSLDQLVRDLVDRAVTEELSRLHTEITRRQA